MLAFTNILNWITKNTTLLLFILISILVALFFYQRNRTQKFKYQYKEEVKETNRIINNWDASLDTLKQIRNKNGVLSGEISGYQITLDEYKDKYDSVFSLYDYEKKKPPKVIIQWKWKIVDLTEIPTVNQGDTLITFSDSLAFDEAGENWRKISVQIPYTQIYKIKPDSSNSFTFGKALRYAYTLREEIGIKDAFVVIYENNKRVSYTKAKNIDSLIYRIQIFASDKDIPKEQIADNFKLDTKDISKLYEDGKYKYMVGMFIPSPLDNKIIPIEELYTYSKLITQPATTKISMGMSVGTSVSKRMVN